MATAAYRPRGSWPTSIMVRSPAQIAIVYASQSVTVSPPSRFSGSVGEDSPGQDPYRARWRATRHPRGDWDLEGRKELPCDRRDYRVEVTRRVGSRGGSARRLPGESMLVARSAPCKTCRADRAWPQACALPGECSRARRPHRGSARGAGSHRRDREGPAGARGRDDPPGPERGADPRHDAPARPVAGAVSAIAADPDPRAETRVH